MGSFPETHNDPKGRGHLEEGWFFDKNSRTDKTLVLEREVYFSNSENLKLLSLFAKTESIHLLNICSISK